MATNALTLAEAPSHGSVFEAAQYNVGRVRTAVRLAGIVGPLAAAKLAYNQLSGNGHQGVYRHPRILRHPIELTQLIDAVVYEEVIKSNVYELPPELSRRVEGDQIVDIGAHIGIAATYFASRYSDSPVLAVEPHPRNFALLERNTRPYSEQVQPLHAALGTEAGLLVGTINLGRSPNSHVAHLYSADYANPLTSETTSPSITGEQIMERLGGLGKIGVLKIDIEGAEREVFTARDTIDPLLENTEVLLIETHDRYVPGSSAAVAAAAARNGLSPYRNGGHTAIYTRT